MHKCVVVGTTLILGLRTSVLHAQETLDGCDIAVSDYDTLVAEAVLGTWRGQVGVGTAMGMGQLIQLDAEDAPPAEPIEITLQGTERVLWLRGQGIPFTIVQGSNLGEYAVEEEMDDGSLVVRMFDDLWATPPNCDFDLLPILKLSGDMMGEDGTPMVASGWLHFINQNNISGTFQTNGYVNGTEVAVRTLLTLTR